MPFGTANQGLPGDRLTGGQGYRLASLLARQNVNNGTMTGGLANVLQQAIMGMMMRGDADAARKLEADQASAGAAMARGASARPWVDPDTGQAAPGQRAGGYEGAMAGLSGLPDNPAAGRLAQALMGEKLKADLVPETFGAPVGAMNREGQGTLLQVGNRGTLKVLDDFGPTPKQLSETASAPMQNFAYRQSLVGKFGEDSPEVKRFDSYVRQNPWINLGGSMGLPSVERPGTLAAEVPKTPAPEDMPPFKGEVERLKALGKGAGDATAAIQKKGSEGVTTLSLLDGIEDKIDRSTGSYAGAARDVAGQVFGVSTPGAEAISELQVIQAALMLNTPRMEGPQSDRDVALYQQATGMIGDSTVPVAMRKAAVRQIRAINEKYMARAGAEAPQAPAANPAPAAVRITGDDDYAKLPSGTSFVGPDGKLRVKQ